MNAIVPRGEHGHAPVDAVVERLNDPGVAASLVTLLDHAELLSTLTLGLGDLVARSETVMDAVAEGVNEFKQAQAVDGNQTSAPSLAELSSIASQLSASVPVISRLLDSGMFNDDTIDLLSMVSEAATEGADKARREGTKVSGVRGALKALKDPEVQQGLGLLVEISRSLGRRMGQ